MTLTLSNTGFDYFNRRAPGVKYHRGFTGAHDISTDLQALTIYPSVYAHITPALVEHKYAQAIM